MADKKYIGKAIALPHDVHAGLTTVQEELTERFGFTPSLSETIAYLIKNRAPAAGEEAK